MKIRINYDLQCEIDRRKCDCRREPAHCHITRHGIRVAQVWLNPVHIEPGHFLEHNEIDPVIRVVSNNQSALVQEYEYNREHGAAY